uniref:Uncharacterized protein n=1 Tax=Panagrolaimus superbus TaxID=310955 RepID=A0A914ZGF8_9BILA
MANENYCHKPYPHMFPEPGTILVFNVETVRAKWHLKKLIEAISETRCDGWSWTQSTGGKKRVVDGEYIMKVDHFMGKNQNTGQAEKEQPFDCWQYTTPNQQWQLLHYLGDTTHIATGYPHKNSKTGKPYLRSCPSLLRNLMSESVTDKPTVYPGYFLPESDTPRSFIDTVGLTRTNLFIHMENPLIFEEMAKVIKETGMVMRLRYDTTFKMGLQLYMLSN